MSSEKTRWVFDEDFSDNEFEGGSGGSADKTGGGGAFTQNIGPAGNTSIETEMMTNNQERTRIVEADEDDASDKTVIFSAANSDQMGEAADFAENVDPVVGWLVILKGPGKGNSIPLGHGLNMIGRSASQRVPMAYGDTLISSEDQAKIIYEERQFFITHGSGKNITKVNGKMVPNLIPLENHALIQLTKVTTLAFVALCGEDFDWADVT